jgi:hypothetical protein
MLGVCVILGFSFISFQSQCFVGVCITPGFTLTLRYGFSVNTNTDTNTKTLQDTWNEISSGVSFDTQI